MANQTSNQSSNNTSNLDPNSNPASVYYPHPSDSGQKLISIPFNGMGFSDWKRAMTITLSGKNKLGFVDGTLKQPSEKTPNYNAWERANNVVMGWLFGSLEPSIAKTVLYRRSAREIWVELTNRYGLSSSARLFSIKEQINKLTHSTDMSVEDSFAKMTGLWDELDCLDPIPVCTCNGCSCNLNSKLTKRKENHRLIHFLMQLDERFKQVRSTILLLPDLPTPSNAYQMVLQEQVHQELTNVNGITDSLACHVEKRQWNDKSKSLQGKNQGKTSKRPTWFCDHCKIYGHTIDKCWKIHGYPTTIKSNT